jgi:hypothetical protein
MFKNMFSFVLTFYAYDWLVANGVKHIFIIIASIQVAICLLSIPMCKFPVQSLVPLLFPPRQEGDLFLDPNNTASSIDIFGKWNRSFFARHDLFKMLHLC